MTIQVEHRRVEDLIPYARNSRTHSDAQVAQIAASIREFGWTNPVLIDGEGGIIAGHGRLLAARQLGLDEVPCIVLDHLSDNQKRALVLADNKLALNAGWDSEMLRLEVADLREADFDVTLAGFSDEDLVAISLERQHGVTDPNAEWEGMPEFSQQDKTAFRSIPIHFKDQAAVDEFAAMVEQKITDRTRFIWFPQIEIETYADKRYVAA